MMRLPAVVERLVTRLVGEWSPDALGRTHAPERLSPVAAAVRRTVLGAALVGVVVQTTLHLAAALLFDRRIDRLNADLDSSVWGWTGVVAEFSTALGAGLLALQVARHRRALVFLAVALAFLSMDDAVQVHERVGGLLTVLGPFEELSRVTWPTLYAPLMLTVFVLLWRLGGALGPRDRQLARAALVVLGSAIVFEFTSPLLLEVGAWRGHLAYDVETVLEEGCELGGWLMLAAVLLSNGLDVAVRSAVAHAPGGGSAAPEAQTSARPSSPGAPDAPRSADQSASPVPTRLFKTDGA